MSGCIICIYILQKRQQRNLSANMFARGALVQVSKTGHEHKCRNLQFLVSSTLARCFNLPFFPPQDEDFKKKTEDASAELQPQENTQEWTLLAAFIYQQSLRLNQSYTKTSLSMSYGHIVKQANLRKEHMKNSYDRQRTLQKKMWFLKLFMVILQSENSSELQWEPECPHP